MQASDVDRFKAAAATSAAGTLCDGMLVGLGSGSTSAMAVAAIGERVKQGLKLKGVPTSEKTADQARLLNIPLVTLEECPELDVTIDGADEIEVGSLNLIKGGGGNLLREKIVAIASKQMLVIADESKLVQDLGVRSSVPVEVVRFGWISTSKRLEQHGAKPVLRKLATGEPLLTDGGNYILDCSFGRIQDPDQLAASVKSLVGVVEHGLFLGIAQRCFIGGPDGVRIVSAT